MRTAFCACLITLASVASINLAVTSFDQAVAQGTQQHNLSPAEEQAVTRGLADQPTQNMPSGFTGQVGSKLPLSETGKPLPSDVQAQVPEVKQMLFVKLPDRVLLIDPDSQAVAEILMVPVTTGSSPGSSGSSGSPTR
jgi:hypothetical protein